MPCGLSPDVYKRQTDFIPKTWEKEKLLATLSSGMKLRRSRTEINLLKEQVEVLSNATAGGSEEVIIGDSLDVYKRQGMDSKVATPMTERYFWMSKG